jgi:hypothetical protein
VLLWLVAVVSLVIALLAWRSALTTSRRLDRLTQMYWTVRYQQTARDDGSSPPADMPADNFISLSSLTHKQESD